MLFETVREAQKGSEEAKPGGWRDRLVFQKRLASCLLSQGRREHQATVGRLFDRQHRRARTRSGPCPGRLEHRWEGPLFFYPF